MSREELQLNLSATEARIVRSARRCFESAGVPKTRIEDIALDAGVSRQTVYKYFSGKEDIVERIGHLEMVKVNVIVREKLHRQGSFAEKLAEAIALSVEVARENPYLRRVIEDANLYPRFPNKSVSIYVWQRAQWSGLLERARRSGELAADLNIDQVVHWIMLSQLTLLMTPEKLPVPDMALKDYVRRFMVEPLLSYRAPNRADAGVQLEMLHQEIAVLKTLVSQQALALHALREKV